MLFNNTLTTKRAVNTQDLQGTDVQDWTAATVIDAAMPACFQQMSAGEVSYFSRRNMDVDFSIFTPRPVTAKQGDRAIDKNGVIYTIQDVDDMAGRGRYFCTAAKKLRGPA